MLPKSHRLTKKRDFETVFKAGKGFKRDFLIVKVLKGQAKNSRFGFVVSKKVSAKAVVRNKVRRRLQQAAFLATEKMSTTADVVFVALPNATKKEFSEIKETVAKVINAL